MSAKEGNTLSIRRELCFTYYIENTEDKYENEETSVPHTNLNLAVSQIFPVESLWRLGASLKKCCLLGAGLQNRIWGCISSQGPRGQLHVTLLPIFCHLESN